MKKVIALILVCLIVSPLFAFWTPSTTAQSSLVFFDDFETGTLNKWDVIYGEVDSPSISTARAHSGSYSVVFNSVGTQYIIAYPEFSSVVEMWHLTGWIYVESFDEPYEYPLLFGLWSNESETIETCLTWDPADNEWGLLYYHSYNNIVFGTLKVETGKWVKIDIYAYYDRKVELWIDNTKILDIAAHLPSHHGIFVGYEPSGASRHQFYFDDISLEVEYYTPLLYETGEQVFNGGFEEGFTYWYPTDYYYFINRNYSVTNEEKHSGNYSLKSYSCGLPGAFRYRFLIETNRISQAGIWANVNGTDATLTVWFIYVGGSYSSHTFDTFSSGWNYLDFRPYLSSNKILHEIQFFVSEKTVPYGDAYIYLDDFTVYGTAERQALVVANSSHLQLPFYINGQLAGITPYRFRVPTSFTVTAPEYSYVDAYPIQTYYAPAVKWVYESSLISTGQKYGSRQFHMSIDRSIGVIFNYTMYTPINSDCRYVYKHGYMVLGGGSATLSYFLMVEKAPEDWTATSFINLSWFIPGNGLITWIKTYNATHYQLLPLGPGWHYWGSPPTDLIPVYIPYRTWVNITWITYMASAISDYWWECYINGELKNSRLMNEEEGPYYYPDYYIGALYVSPRADFEYYIDDVRIAGWLFDEENWEYYYGEFEEGFEGEGVIPIYDYKTYYASYSWNIDDLRDMPLGDTQQNTYVNYTHQRIINLPSTIMLDRLTIAFHERYGNPDALGTWTVGIKSSPEDGFLWSDTFLPYDVYGSEWEFEFDYNVTVSNQVYVVIQYDGTTDNDNTADQLTIWGVIFPINTNETAHGFNCYMMCSVSGFIDTGEREPAWLAIWDNVQNPRRTDEVKHSGKYSLMLTPTFYKIKVFTIPQAEARFSIEQTMYYAPTEILVRPGTYNFGVIDLQQTIDNTTYYFTHCIVEQSPPQVFHSAAFPLAIKNDTTIFIIYSTGLPKQKPEMPAPPPEEVYCLPLLFYITLGLIFLFGLYFFSQRETWKTAIPIIPTVLWLIIFQPKTPVDQMPIAFLRIFTVPPWHLYMAVILTIAACAVLLTKK